MLFSCTNSAGQRQKGFLALLILNVAAFSRTTLVSADSRSLHAARLQRNRGHKLQHFKIWNLPKPNQTSNNLNRTIMNEAGERKTVCLSASFRLICRICYRLLYYSNTSKFKMPEKKHLQFFASSWMMNLRNNNATNKDMNSFCSSHKQDKIFV